MGATNDLLVELPDGIMYEHQFLQQGLQLLKEVLCAKSTITLLLGILGVILLRKSLLGRKRQGSDRSDTVTALLRCALSLPVLRCASCGIAEVDDIKLKPCDDCDLVRYCSDECQELHRPEHAGKCKERAAELRDEILFRQPEGTHLGDCPICFLPFPLGHNKFMSTDCCTTMVCMGCAVATLTCRGLEEEQVMGTSCPFCRAPVTKTEEEKGVIEKKRIDANDPFALWQMGQKHYQKEEYETGFEYSRRAAELGDAAAHFDLSISYRKGEGVEKDEKKANHHLEQAAIGGHPHARRNLANWEWEYGKRERAMKHWIIAANLGDDVSLNTLKDLYKAGAITKDAFAEVLRGHYAAVVATKSSQRQLAEKKYPIGH